jgi:hypothetical protein
VSVDWVRLELDISRFEPTRFADLMAEVQGAGIRLTTLAELGNTTAQQQSLYALNAECAADIPDRGPFFTWSEFRRTRLDVPSFEPHGVVVAFDRDSWVGSRLARKHLDAPLSADARRLALGHLRRMREQFDEHLDDDDLHTLDVLSDADDLRSVMHRSDVFVTASRQILVAQLIGGR